MNQAQQQRRREKRIVHGVLAAIYGGPGMMALMMGGWGMATIGIGVGLFILWVGEQ